MAEERDRPARPGTSAGRIIATLRREFAIHGPNSREALAKLVIEECRELANVPLLTQEKEGGK